MGGLLEQGGGVEVGGVGFRLCEGCRGAGGLWRKLLGKRCHLFLLRLEGPSLGAPPRPQDVDSRDRRRRELGPPESQQPREQPEPSTSWWPVSSAEKKKNFTLVRAGPTRSGRDSGRGRWHDRCGGKGSAWSFRVRAACDEG